MITDDVGFPFVYEYIIQSQRHAVKGNHGALRTVSVFVPEIHEEHREKYQIQPPHQIPQQLHFAEEGPKGFHDLIPWSYSKIGV